VAWPSRPGRPTRWPPTTASSPRPCRTAQGAQPLDLKDPAGTAVRIASSASVWFGLVIFALSAAVWLIVLSRASLSFAYPFASLTYVIILMFDRFVLDQSIPGIRYAGVALIIAGIILVSRTNA
jgi:drug/metabolite transporter (DMT)-like permease